MSDAAGEPAHELHAAGESWHRPWAAAIIVAGAAAALAIGLLGLPRDASALPTVARHALTIALPVWGQADPVNEVVYGSRGFDTFGETFLLLAAIVTVSTLARPKEPRREYLGEAVAGGREQADVDRQGGDQGTDEGEREARGAEGAEEDGNEPLPDPDRLPLGARAPERAEAMTVVVRVAARIATVILSVAGIYLAAWGYTPGGGFPAGVALTGVALLIYAAFGREAIAPVVRPAILEPLEMLGALVIVGIGVGGLVAKDALFANWLPLAEPETILAGGTNQPYSGAELIEVATGLSIAIFALLGMGHDWTPEEDDADDGSDEMGDGDQGDGDHGDGASR